MEGWIKIHRRFSKWKWFKKPEMVQLFTYLLLEANYRKAQWEDIVLEVGQVVISRENVCKELGMSPQVFRTCIKRLISTNEITTESTNRYTIVTICNYCSYQENTEGFNQQNSQEYNQQSTSEQPASNQQSTKDKEYKEINNNILLTRERDRFDERKDILLNRAFWVENNLRVHKLDLPEFKEWLDKFFDMLRCGGKTDIEEEEAAMYASNWIRDQISKQNKQQKQNGTNKQTTGSGKGEQPSSVRVRVAEIP